ncbi:MAG TPA: hypothetical protein VM925_29830 [Labilithrix sp.]|nr:hypothetical protein [Labilithrix sp.]
MACENDSGVGGPSFSFDASLADFNAPPPNDGSTPTPSVDAAPDAPVVPAVSVTVTGAGGPKSGVRIVFHDAAGAVIETKLTGNDGKATHVGTDAGMASALLATGSQRHIVTWTGVETGDDLQVRDGDSNEDVGLYNVSLSSLFVDSGASIYWVEGPCGGNSTYGTAAELPLRRGCTRAQNAVLATARTFSSTVTGHAFKKGNPGVTDGGTASITVGDWKEPSTLGLTIANLPVETSFDSHLLEIADGAGFSNSTGDTNGSNVTFKTATGFADAYQASIRFGDFGGSEQSITRRFAPAATVELDYAGLLPSITDASLDTAAPRRPVISWSTDSTAGTDGGLVQFSFSGPEDANYLWTLVVPPGSKTVTAPAMPAEAESFLPFDPDSGGESWFGVPEILFVEADVLPSYAFFRRQQGTLLGLTESGFGAYSLPALPLDGTYKTTSWTAILR